MKKLVAVILAVVCVIGFSACIVGVPLKEAKMSVKAYGTDVSGTFTGTWSLVKGKEGMFTAEEGWVFEGNINPDGGMRKGELTNFPIPAEWRENSISDLPEFYTGAVDDNVLIDIKPR